MKCGKNFEFHPQSLVPTFPVREHFAAFCRGDNAVDPKRKASRSCLDVGAKLCVVNDKAVSNAKHSKQTFTRLQQDGCNSGVSR